MADDFFTRTPNLASGNLESGNRSAGPAPARRSIKGIVFAVLIAFLLGAGAIGYLAWSGLLPKGMAGPDRLLVDGGTVPTISPGAPITQPSGQPVMQPAVAAIPAQVLPCILILVFVFHAPSGAAFHFSRSSVPSTARR